MSSFSAATYNLLANAYVHYAYYRRTPKIVLDPAWRSPAIVAQVINLAADVLCLQEVEPHTFTALKTRLGPLGYAAQYARKLGGKPDGCATFYRQDKFELLTTRVVEYADGVQGKPDSGHIGLITVLRTADRLVSVANTHLIWDPPGTPSAAKLGYRQALQLLNECQSLAASCDGWLVCGDLNATRDSEIVALFKSTGLEYSHVGLPLTYTCNVNGEAKMIDYLFYSPEFRAEPQKLPEISDRTILPSSEQPSDHLAVVSRFFWK
jgi:mRNA deadenylase 3'-5' endonuclease subunit Ccr4